MFVTSDRQNSLLKIQTYFHKVGSKIDLHLCTFGFTFCLKHLLGTGKSGHKIRIDLKNSRVGNGERRVR